MNMRRPADIYIVQGKLIKSLQSLIGETVSFPPKSNHSTQKTIIVDKGGILIRVSENSGGSTRSLSATTGLS
ncbi:hypothetical protein NQ318_016028 [Aromia moschata]|uniref:Uncharacterized protein n=1 Tax=Aromia moschata TaxID=1265417 RepID=A0AAV8XNW9_9CUCU|nr:hypothetical protein NQ318_016028 [Aromia moschata]